MVDFSGFQNTFIYLNVNKMKTEIRDCSQEGTPIKFQMLTVYFWTKYDAVYFEDISFMETTE